MPARETMKVSIEPIKTKEDYKRALKKIDSTVFPRQRQKMCVETVISDQVKWDEGHREQEHNEESVISYSYRSLEVSKVAEEHAR